MHKIGDENPGFAISEFLLRLVFAYDYAKEGATPEQHAKIKTWLLGAAHYWRGEVDYHLNKFFVDRSAGTDELTSYARNAFEGSWFGVKQLTHYNGRSVWREGLLYNNRRANIVRFVAHVGVLYNDRELIQSAKLFFREWIRFGVFPDGVVTEFERWEPYAPNWGWDYAASSIALMIDTADVLARAGEPDLYLYQTSGGRHGTEGGAKNLLLTMRNLGSYLDGSAPARYGTDQASLAGNINYRIDGNLRIDDYNPGKFTHRDVWFTPANLFLKDTYIKGLYTRQGAGLSGYPTSDKIASAGPHKPWSGVGNAYPSMLFQFGLLENVVSPYPAAITPPPSPAYNRTRCP